MFARAWGSECIDSRITENPSVDSNIRSNDSSNTPQAPATNFAQVEAISWYCPSFCESSTEREGEIGRRCAIVGIITWTVFTAVWYCSPECSGISSRSLYTRRQWESVPRRVERKDAKNETNDDDGCSSVDDSGDGWSNLFATNVRPRIE